ncbi:MAG TPA: NmrA family NAD(P)-binding protein [Terriglobia bacterium]|nr:NmrA family NAD(P)-binding protein [Terriglobia bacterium]
MFAIAGATGNTGSVIAETLLARGEKVRVIGRGASRLAPFVKKGAEAAVSDVTDVSGLTKAFQGARAVYALVPPNIGVADVRGYQEAVTDALASAIDKASVSHAVILSSIGADLPAGTGPVVGLHNLEQKLNSIRSLNAVYLRAGYFMENILPQVDVIHNFGIVGGPVRADLRLPMIATRDIGAAAADLLLKLDFTEKNARELLGGRDLDYREAASIIGKAIGRSDLAYSQLPPQQLKPALMQMGMSSNMADLLLEMAEALNTAQMTARETRSARNTTPTSLETFVAEEFVPRFQKKASGAAGA